MDVLIQVINLFLLMSVGFLIAKKNILGNNGVSSLNSLVVYFTLPCLTFAKLQEPSDPLIVGNMALTFFVASAYMLICGVAGYFMFKREPHNRRAVFMQAVIFPNSGFMGFPILAAALGEGNIIYGVMYVAAFNLISWTLGVYLFAGKSAFSMKGLITNPTLIAVVLGLACFALNLQLPKLPLDAINMLGSLTTPLTMLIVGARLFGITRKHLTDITMLAVCGLRLLVLPLILLGILSLFPISHLVKATLYICTAMPVAAATAMQAEHYGGDKALASHTVAVSTALSVVTIPLVLLLI